MFCPHQCRGAFAAKGAAGLLLVAIAVAALAFGLVRETRIVQSESPAAAAVPPQELGELDAVIVYYFHGDTRCQTCLAIEAETRRVLQVRFADDMEFGLLRFDVINTDLPENRHFALDYDLAFGSVVVQAPEPSGRWENLAEVWTRIHDSPSVFEDYLVRHVRSALEPHG